DLSGMVAKVVASLDEEEVEVAFGGTNGNEHGGRPKTGRIFLRGSRPRGERASQGIDEPLRHQPKCSRKPAPSMPRRRRPSAIRYPTKTITERFFKKAISP